LRAWILSKKSQIGTVSLAVLLVIATAAATIALTHQPHEAVASAPEDTVRVSVIGDSYSSGLGNQTAWPSLIAAGSQLSISDVAFPGTGYVAETGHSGSFAAQVNKALASKPDVVVVFGGMSDASVSDGLIAQSATDLFLNLIRLVPKAKLIVLGPISPADPVSDRFLKLDSTIAGVAQATHTTYIRLIQEKWLVGEGLIQADGFSPTDQGQSVLAQRLGPVLQGAIRKHDKAVLP
jgi:lysophospholipase L1-like esterase